MNAQNHILHLTSFSKMSAHLQSLSESVAEIEAGLGWNNENAPAMTPEQIMQLQTLDRLRQSLRDLAVIAQSVPVHHDLELSDKVFNDLWLNESKLLFTTNGTNEMQK